MNSDVPTTVETASPSIEFRGDSHGSVRMEHGVFGRLMSAMDMRGVAFEMRGNAIRPGRVPARMLEQRLARCGAVLSDAGVPVDQTDALLDLAAMNRTVAWSTAA